MKMFCNQCERTDKGTGCTVRGHCGKTAPVADRQDRLVLALRRLAKAVRAGGVSDPAIDDFMQRGLFMTLTNVNFDPVAIESAERACTKLALSLEARKAGAPEPDEAAVEAAMTLPEGVDISVGGFADDVNVRSAMQILLYGLKGTAAYAYHATRLGRVDPTIAEYMYEALEAGPADGRDLGGWLDLCLRCGKANLRAMELLDEGNTSTFGNPVPTAVNLGHRKGKCILVSGHDLHDLEMLLKQTEGTGINIYTHGEMIPAHGYPELHKYPHLAGHFGTAWNNQKKQLPDFPGAVLFTTNCLQNPGAYGDKVFTTGVVGWPGVKHCPDGDFSAVIEKALAMPGYEDDAPGAEVMTGFGRQTILDAAPVVLQAATSGALRHIFLVGGCDADGAGRSYFSEFVEKTPPDTLVLTLGCGKFRFFDKKLGTLGPFPRLLDMGQCNDAYGAVRVALALADALKCGVNDLPLSLVISWYEQKAASIFLTLLYLGVRNIRLGPTLPAFVSPDILKVLVDGWNIMPTTTPDEDLKAILG